MNIGQLLSQGLTFGAIYAAIALGYHLIHVSSGVLNFALGEQLAVAGLICLTFLDAGLPLPLAIVAAVVVGTLLGAAYDRLALAPSKRMGPTGPIIASIGVALIYTHGRTLVWGPNPRDFPPFTGSANETVEFLGARWLIQSFWVIGIALGVALLIFWFLRWTSYGRAWRATAESSLGARLSGIDPAAVETWSVAAVSAMLTLVGIAAAPIVLAGGFFGIAYGVKGFAAAILGGFDSTPGVLVGGLMVGLVDSFLIGTFGREWSDIILFLLLIVTLIVRPTGLLGRPELSRA